MRRFVFIVALAGSTVQLGCDAQTSSEEKGDDTTDDSLTTKTLSKDSQETQTIEVAGGDIRGTSVSFPPGSLTIDADITVETGSDIANSLAASELQLEGGSEALAVAGPAVVVSSSVSQDTQVPFTLAIPVASGAGLSLATCANIVVVFRVSKAAENGDAFVGVIPTTDLTVATDKVSFATTHFGSFQAACAKQAVAQKLEVKSVIPIGTKSDTTILSGSWRKDCHQESNNTGNGGSTTAALIDHENTWRKNTLVFTGTGFVYREESFSDAACTQARETGTYSGSYSIGGAYAGIAGATEMDIVLTKIIVTILDPARVQGANAEGKCGFTDWAAGVPKVYPATGCPDAEGDDGPPMNEPYYMSFKKDGDSLYLSSGEDEGDNSPTSRGTALESRPFVRE